jgi:hypothetical protein
VIERAPQPAAVAPDPVTAITSAHERAGLAIGERTSTVRYTHRPDYDACVAAAT